MSAVDDRRDDDTTILHIEGPFRAPGATELRKKVEALLRRGERRIVLDLGGVSDLDAAGLGELVRARNTTIAAHGLLWITHACGKARVLLARVGLLSLLEETS